MCFVGGFQVTLFTTGFAENAVLQLRFPQRWNVPTFCPSKEVAQSVDYHAVLETAFKKGVMSTQKLANRG